MTDWPKLAKECGDEFARHKTRRLHATAQWEPAEDALCLRLYEWLDSERFVLLRAFVCPSDKMSERGFKQMCTWQWRNMREQLDKKPTAEWYEELRLRVEA
jgi:hypothetical protein